MSEYCEICNSYHDKETRMVPMHRRAEKIRDENIQLREQLAEAQEKLEQANKYTNMWADAAVNLQAELKEAQGRIEGLENALHDLLAVLQRGNLKMRKAVLALENTLQRKKDAG